jgi:hypothetical protein
LPTGSIPTFCERSAALTFRPCQSVLSPEVGDDDEIALGMGSFRCLDDWGFSRPRQG